MSRLKHLLRLNYGDALSHEDRREGEVPVFGSNGKVGTHDEANTVSPCIVVGRKGSFGKVAWSDVPIYCIDTAFFVDGRSCDGVLRFAYYALQTLALDDLSRDTGIPGLSRDDAHNRPLSPRSLDDQAAIAAYLDRATARIDRLIDKKATFIRLLKEKRSAIAARAVTTGIHGDRHNVPMRDSSIEWIGQIPAHWETTRIANLFQEVNRPADPNLPVLSVSIHSGVTDRELDDDERGRTVNLSEDRSKYQRVQSGDLVYNMMRAWQGAIGSVTVDGLVSPAYIVAEPKTEFRTKFIEILLQTPSGTEEIRRYSKGIADFRMRLYWEHFRNIGICLPPVHEQDEIIRHIDRETARIDNIMTKTIRSIELLREHRAALIDAAVTGKIDVRSNTSPDLEAAA